MDLSRDFIEEVDRVISACEERVALYPENIREHAKEYLKKLNLSRKPEEQAAGFCYLMPFWLKDIYQLSNETCHKIALGNIFALLYFMSQDEVMDSKNEEHKAKLLPLSSLFYMDFISQYHELFESSSPFWRYFEEYMFQWSKSLVWEETEHWGKLTAYDESSFILMSRKAAPLKIPFAAIAILGNTEADIELYTEMMDYDQAVYQIIDDWRDWKEDLADGKYSYFLTRVAQHCNIENPLDLKEEHVNKAVFAGFIMEDILKTAFKYNKKCFEFISHIDSPYLKRYLNLELDILNKILSDIEKERELLLSGGLYSLLNKLL